MRHKSTVDCDFRPRPKSFSETTWIFPKQGKDIYTSTFERNQLVDTTWYKSKVSVTSTEPAEQNVNGHMNSTDYMSTEEVFEETTPHNGFGSSDEEQLIITNNNVEKSYRIKNGSLGSSVSSDEE